MDASEWNARWASPDRQVRDEPHPLVAEAASTLRPGAALDLGCGEGRNALWLAERGWAVTGVDFSEVALSRAKAAADRRGVDVAWVEADLFTYIPAPAAFDLVLMVRVHPLPAARKTVFRSASAALRPGGTLITVGFDRAGFSREGRGPADPSQLYAIDEICAELAPLEIVKAESVLTSVDTPEGPRSRADIIVRARKAGAAATAA